MRFCKFEFRIKSIACCVVMGRDPLKVKENIDVFPVPLSFCNHFEELHFSLVVVVLFNCVWKVALFLPINQSSVLLWKSNQEVPEQALFSACSPGKDLADHWFNGIRQCYCRCLCAGYQSHWITLVHAVLSVGLELMF